MNEKRYLGDLENFNVQCFLDAARELVRGDEVILALRLLEGLPAFYRDFPPKEILDLRNQIMTRIATPMFYAREEKTQDTSMKDLLWMKKTTRGQLIIKDVKAFNDNNLNPHILDYGPGEFYVPEILFDEGHYFTYNPVTITPQSSAKFFDDKPHFRGDPDIDDPSIFFACEIIEHLWQESELKTVMLSYCGLADVIHVSTPKYTFDGRSKWSEMREDLGHLRAYTPNEFVNKIALMFPEYLWQFFDNQILHMRLIRKDSEYFHLLKEIK